jgi:hypothetical protein
LLQLAKVATNQRPATLLLPLTTALSRVALSGSGMADVAAWFQVRIARPMVRTRRRVGTTMGRPPGVAVYVTALIAVVVGVDVLFFRHHFLSV